MKSGLFIVLEGPNRAGKTTLIDELATALRESQREVIVTREPGGTPLGEGLRAVLKNDTMSGGTFATALVFNGARKEHADRVITPGLQRGAVVLCDRYYMSTEIFQGALADDISTQEETVLAEIHRSSPQPDLTIFLLPSPAVVAARGNGKEADRFEGDPREFSAYEAYAERFSKSYPTLFIRPTLEDEHQSKLPLVWEHELWRKAKIINDNTCSYD
jgi:dTMP kinase